MSTASSGRWTNDEGFEYWHSYFAAVLGTEYFDGPMAGVGVLPDKSAHYFKIVGWDDEHSGRVFATAEIPTRIAEALWTVFEAVEPPRLPEWYPQSVGAGEVQTKVDAAITAVGIESQRAGFSKALQSRDLVGNTTGVVLDDSQSRAIQRMVFNERIVELGTAPILQGFPRNLRR